MDQGDLESILPADLKKRAISSGNELILPYADALRSITIANEHQIAILGIEAIDILPPGRYSFYVSNYTGYDNDIKFAGNWQAYVAANNSEAERWLKAHVLGDGHGYILTSTSEKEFAALGSKR